MQPYRTLGAALGWFAILAQYWLSTSEAGFLPGTITYFSFFTILGNILVALAFALPLAPGLTPAAFFSRPGVRTALGVYIVVIGVVFYFLLRKIYHPTGLGWWVNILLHYIIPPLYVLDWLLFVPKRGLAFRHIPLWLIFPLTYTFYTLLHGALSGYYPYPFLDAATYGYPQILTNIAALTAFFVLISTAFITAARYLPLPTRR